MDRVQIVQSDHSAPTTIHTWFPTDGRVRPGSERPMLLLCPEDSVQKFLSLGFIKKGRTGSLNFNFLYQLGTKPNFKNTEEFKKELQKGYITQLATEVGLLFFLYFYCMYYIL